MTVQQFDTLDVLRLEVADDPTGLVNLVANPSGELGGWGWLTPLASTAMTGDGENLRFDVSATQAAHFTTEPLPVAAGRWVAARLDLTSTSAGTVTIKARFRWLDSGLNELSLSTQTAAHSGGVLNVAPVEAPASTAYVELRIDVYVSGGNATAGTWVELNGVTVADAATSGELGDVRINLVPNPSFEAPLGTRGWSAVTNCTIDDDAGGAAVGAQSCLITATAAGLCLVRSDAGKLGMPVVGGASYAVQAKFRAVTDAAPCGVQVAWYTAAGDYAGTSNAGMMEVVDGTGGYTLTSFVGEAPGGAAFAAIGLLLDAGAAGEQHRADAVMLERSEVVGTYFDGDTADGGGVTNDYLTHAPRVVSTRINLATNPSAETNITGWTDSVGLGGGTLARVTGVAIVGSASFRLTFTDTATMGQETSAFMPVTAGKSYVLMTRHRKHIGEAAADTRIQIVWFNAAGASVGTGPISPTVLDSDTWTAANLVATAPAGATKAKIRAYVDPAGGSSIGDRHYRDAILFEQASTVGDYFDGDTADEVDGWLATDRAWTGTAHASTSTETETLTLPYSQQIASTLPFIEPIEYVNILGSSHSIKVVREELNVGTLEASIADAALDPAQSTVIRPGRRTRLLVLTEGEWRPLFTGKILNGRAVYDPLAANESKRAAITMTAVDDLSALAQHRRSGGVEEIDELPYVLEGCGVPWNVNGSGDQVPTATVVALNDNATAVDQVAVTRDNHLGRAWLDTRGILQAWDADQLDTTIQATLDETTYSDVSIDYDTDRCINIVSIVFLRPNGNGTEEIPYGPYEDAASVAEWGPHSAEFRIQWATEDETAIEAYAAQILGANATPGRRINSVRLPIRTLDDLSATAGEKRALLDLVDLVTASNAETGLSTDVRVAKLEHNITAREGIQWTVDLEFYADGSVAPPQVIPSPPTSTTWWPEWKGLHGNPSLCPDGWLVMDGSTFSASEFPLLDAHLVSLGLASGVLPNFTDRIPIGAGTKAVQSSGGSSTKTLAVANLPPHAHGIARATGTGTGSRVAQGSATAASTQNTTDAGSGDPFDVMNPWRATYFIIRAR